MQATNKKDFWIGHAKSFGKVFAFFFVLFAWIFDASEFGVFFWATFFAAFFASGGIYLSIDNLITDEEVLARIYAGVK